VTPALLPHVIYEGARDVKSSVPPVRCGLVGAFTTLRVGRNQSSIRRACSMVDVRRGGSIKKVGRRQRP